MATEDIVTRVTLETVIRSRIVDRRWYRQQPNRDAYYGDLDRENTVALRELLRVRRIARREAARQDARNRALLSAGDHFAMAS